MMRTWAAVARAARGLGRRVMSVSMSMSTITIATVSLLTAGVRDVDALMFEPVRLDDRRLVLLARDCGKQGFKDTGCTAETRSFSAGDGVRIRQALGRAAYDEVWLISHGGRLLEGIEVGNALREYQATVRVPAGYQCVSACTVAFLGGLFRIVDDGASYEVHAASSFSGLLDSDYQQEVLKMLNWDPGAEYARFASRQLDRARELAAMLLPFFQQSLLPLDARVSNAGALARWRQSAPSTTYSASEQCREDAARFRREGVTSAQETLMRIERDSMAQAIDELRAELPALGPRAGAALEMLAAMYSSRITFTASLSRQTLVEMGYVTLFITPPRP
jgi:hypothetical protein